MAKTTSITNADLINKCMSMVSDIVEFPSTHIWMDYDTEADVLYISFRKPQKATKTIETEGDFLIRKDGRKIVGLTIMNASMR